MSLDEVYLHYFNFTPLQLIGAEAFTVAESNPLLKFPNGYGIHVIIDIDNEKDNDNGNTTQLQHPSILAPIFCRTKILPPINGSIARAHKHYNEYYYAVGKGSDCTLETSGTF